MPAVLLLRESPTFYNGQPSLGSTVSTVRHVYGRFPRQHWQRQCFQAINSTASRGTTRQKQTTGQTQIGARPIVFGSAQAGRCGWQRYGTRLSSHLVSDGVVALGFHCTLHNTAASLLRAVPNEPKNNHDS